VDAIPGSAGGAAGPSQPGGAVPERPEPGAGLGTDSVSADGDPIEAALAELLAGEASELEGGLEALCRARPEWSSALRRRAERLRALGLWPADGAGGQASGSVRILGDFELIEVLGSGGMGIVYRARQRSLEREVAVKVVRPEYLLFPGSRERFRREIDVIARLKHPSIVPVYACGEAGGVPYFAMELVEGRSLAQILGAWQGREPGRLSGADLARETAGTGAAPGLHGAQLAKPWWRLALELAREVAQGLAHAHASGAIHRDIKPSNILVTRGGRARLFDFGLTSTAGAEPITHSGSQPGTLPYMSPEQLRGEPLDARSDLYSLGATLYELLGLRRAFEAPTGLGLVAQIEAGAAPPLHKRCPHLSRAVSDLVAVAMEPRRERRYQSAEALVEDLTRALEGRPLLARPPGPLGRAWSYGRRHPALAAAAGSLLLLVGGLPTGLYWQSREHASELAASLVSERSARTQAQALSLALGERTADLSASLERESAALGSAQAALSDAEMALGFLCNLVLEAAPERLGGQPFDLDRLLHTALEGAHQLAERPGVQARFLLCLGDVFVSLSDLEPAEVALRQALAIERRVSGGASAWGLRTLNSLATALQRQGRGDEALPLFEEALAGQRALRGERHLATAAALNNLAGAELAGGRLEGAIEHFEAAARCYAGLEPAEALYSAIARANLAYALRRAGALERIPAALAEAEGELERAAGAEPLVLARARNVLASVWLDQGEPARGLLLLEPAIQTFAARLPGPDPYWAAACFNRGSARLALGDPAAALPDLEAAVAQSAALGQALTPDGQRYRAKLEACSAALASPGRAGER
jgi:tetratricopeptide (TPR) repeat protein